MPAQIERRARSRPHPAGARPSASHSSFDRPSMCTRTTAGAGAIGRLVVTCAAMVRPVGRGERHVRGPMRRRSWREARLTANATQALDEARGTPRPAHATPARAPRDSPRTACRSPTKRAWLMSACPIETSSRCGSVRNSVRFRRSRSWPALTPSPISCASVAAATYSAKLACAAAGPRSNARANGSV